MSTVNTGIWIAYNFTGTHTQNSWRSEVSEFTIQNFGDFLASHVSFQGATHPKLNNPKLDCFPKFEISMLAVDFTETRLRRGIDGHPRKIIFQPNQCSVVPFCCWFATEGSVVPQFS